MAEVAWRRRNPNLRMFRAAFLPARAVRYRYPCCLKATAPSGGTDGFYRDGNPDTPDRHEDNTHTGKEEGVGVMSRTTLRLRPKATWGTALAVGFLFAMVLVATFGLLTAIGQPGPGELALLSFFAFFGCGGLAFAVRATQSLRVVISADTVEVRGLFRWRSLSREEVSSFVSEEGGGDLYGVRKWDRLRVLLSDGSSWTPSDFASPQSVAGREGSVPKIVSEINSLLLPSAPMEED